MSKKFFNKTSNSSRTFKHRGNKFEQKPKYSKYSQSDYSGEYTQADANFNPSDNYKPNNFHNNKENNNKGKNKHFANSFKESNYQGKKRSFNNNHSNNNHSFSNNYRKGSSFKGQKFTKENYNNNNRRNILHKVSIEQVVHYLSLHQGVINLDTYNTQHKETLYGKINLLAQHNILCSTDNIIFTVNKAQVANEIPKYLVIRIKKELLANHYLIAARPLDTTEFSEEEVMLPELNENLKRKLIIVEISSEGEKLIAKPLFYLEDYEDSPQPSNSNYSKNNRVNNKQIAKGIFQKYEGINFFIPISFKSRTNYILHNIPEDLPIKAVIEVEIESGNPNVPSANFLKVLKADKISTSLSMLSVHQYNLPYEFSTEALTQAKQATQCTVENRKDIRDLPLVTIDGEDAKDFDDAIYAEKIPNSDSYKIYVAIADVSYYVKAGSPLDMEAQNRGNSVYLPGYVIPMLPEELSNGWCSLQPLEDRGCVLVEMVINRNGIMEDFQFSRCLMKSKARLTYTEVQNALNGNISEHIAPYMDSTIKPIFEAYKLLNQEREKRHTLEINVPETKIILDSNDNIIDITINKSLTAHKIIEEFMISANIAAAKMVRKYNIPSILSIYRVHSEPSLEKLEEFHRVLKSFNMFESIPRKVTGTFFNHLLEKYKHHPLFNSLNENILRTQQQAIYDNNNIGHFGLGLQEYSHFTSPIRRYADLMVHRLILSMITPENPYKYSAPEVSSIAEHISITERVAFNAENMAKSRILAKWLASRIGETFSAYISSITQAGLFVNLTDIGASGLVPIRSISNSYVMFDAINHTIKNRAKKKLYKLGDKVQVILSATDEIRGLITFSLAKPHF